MGVHLMSVHLMGPASDGRVSFVGMHLKGLCLSYELYELCNYSLLNIT